MGGPLGPHSPTLKGASYTTLMEGRNRGKSLKMKTYILIHKCSKLASLEGNGDPVCAVTAHATARVHRHATLETQKPPWDLLVSHYASEGAKNFLKFWREKEVYSFDLHGCAFLEKSVTKPKSYWCYSFPSCWSQYFLYTFRSIFKLHLGLIP